MSRSATRSVPPTCASLSECRHASNPHAMEQTLEQLQAVVDRSLTREQPFLDRGIAICAQTGASVLIFIRRTIRQVNPF